MLDDNDRIGEEIFGEVTTSVFKNGWGVNWSKKVLLEVKRANPSSLALKCPKVHNVGGLDQATNTPSAHLGRFENTSNREDLFSVPNHFMIGDERST